MSACCGVQVDESGQPSAMPTQVALVCPRQQAPAPGQEITIDYGDKSNEQLLLNYGECIDPARSCPALPCPSQHLELLAPLYNKQKEESALFVVKRTPAAAISLTAISAVGHRQLTQAYCLLDCVA